MSMDGAATISNLVVFNVRDGSPLLILVTSTAGKYDDRTGWQFTLEDLCQLWQVRERQQSMTNESITRALLRRNWVTWRVTYWREEPIVGGKVVTGFVTNLCPTMPICDHKMVTKTA
jgi:hypothetical protein